MSCINLKERFGRRYRIGYDESYYAEHGPGARAEDPSMMIVLCRFGHVFPWQGDLLAASVDGHPNVAGLLRKLPCCRVQQDGDFGELTVVFDVTDFPQVARVMRPRRRRQVSAEQREALVARLRPGRPAGPDRPSQGEPTAPRSPAGSLDDCQAVLCQRALF